MHTAHVMVTCKLLTVVSVKHNNNQVLRRVHKVLAATRVYTDLLTVAFFFTTSHNHSTSSLFSFLYNKTSEVKIFNGLYS